MKRSEHIALILIVVLAATLRLYRLDHASVWDDTARTFLTCSAHDWRGVLEMNRRFLPANAPLDPMLRHGFMSVTACNTYCFTLPSVIFSVAGLVCVFLLARRLFDTRIALITVLLLAIQPFDLHHAQEGRNYAILNITVPLATLFFLNALQTNWTRWWLLYAVTLAACFYAHLVTAGIAIAHGLFVLGWAFQERWTGARWTTMARRLGPYTLSAALAILLFSPWLHYVLETRLAARGPEWGDGQCLHSPRAVIETFLGHHLNSPLKAFLLVLPIIGLVQTWARKTTFLVIAVTMPVAYVVSYVATISSFFHVRYVYFLLPFFLMLTAQGIDRIALLLSNWLCSHDRLADWRPWLGPNPLLAVIIGVLVASTIPNLIKEYAGGPYFDGDWRPAVRYVDRNFRDGDSFVIPHVYAPRVSAYTGLPLDGVALVDGSHRLTVGEDERVRALTGKRWEIVACSPDALQTWLEQSSRRAARLWVLCATPAACAEDDALRTQIERFAKCLEVKTFKGVTVAVYGQP